MDQPFFLFIQLLHTFNSIIQNIPKQCTDVHIFHKIQRTSVCHTRQSDPIILTIQTFTCQNSIQHFVPRLILGFINLDFFFHLLQILYQFSAARFRFQKCDLVLQIVILLIHNLNTLLRKLIILILHLQNILQCIHLEFHLQFPHLNMIRIENRHPAQIYQSPDNKHFCCKLTAERTVLVNITQVTDCKYCCCNEQNRKQLPTIDMHFFAAFLQILFQQI